MLFDLVMLLAKLTGEYKPSWIAEWVKHGVEQLYEMKVVPNKKKHSAIWTYRWVLQETIQAEEFEWLVSLYHQLQREKVEEVVLSMDGERLKGTIAAGETRGSHLLSIYVPEEGFVLA
jgi:hypothetical protein